MAEPDLFDTELSKDIIGKEGAYVNNKDDLGGETIWGIIEATARKNGYTGPMRDMPRSTALAIYKSEYYIKPGFDRVAAISPRIAAELFDTGVNMGQSTGIRWLQRGLNALNQKGVAYPDINVDGIIGRQGTATLNALRAFLRIRGGTGVEVMMKVLNGLQVARYIEIMEAREANETFGFGWLDKRVNMG